MQSYLYIGGNQDSLNIPTPDGAESVQLPRGVTDKDVYIAYFEKRIRASSPDAEHVDD